MTCNEIISGQMTEMREKIVKQAEKLAVIKVLLDEGAFLHKTPECGENGCYIFTDIHYHYMLKLRERMYAALR